MALSIPARISPETATICDDFKKKALDYFSATPTLRVVDLWLDWEKHHDALFKAGLSGFYVLEVDVQFFSDMKGRANSLLGLYAINVRTVRNDRFSAVVTPSFRMATPPETLRGTLPPGLLWVLEDPKVVLVGKQLPQLYYRFLKPWGLKLHHMVDSEKLRNAM